MLLLVLIANLLNNPVTVIVIIVIVMVSLIGGGYYLLLKPYFDRQTRQRLLAESRQLFGQRRGRLEKDFLDSANLRGIPRGLIWVTCEFESDVYWARDRRNGKLKALVPVTIGFEAEPGGDMEEVEAVGNLRAGTAVFVCEGGEWTTAGQAIFNLDPMQAIEHFQDELEIVE